jgi:hypothetical protein
MSLHAVDRSVGFDRAALEASEAGRARTLLETLRNCSSANVRCNCNSRRWLRVRSVHRIHEHRRRNLTQKSSVLPQSFATFRGRFVPAARTMRLWFNRCL